MIVDEIYRHQPDIIAATTWLFNHEQLLHITARLKALLPNSYFILGGPEFLGNNEDFLHKNPFIDCVFRGEGEEAFPQWLSCWNQPEKWNSIPGLCYMNPQKQYIDNGIAVYLTFHGSYHRKTAVFQLEQTIRTTGDYPRLFQHMRILRQR